MARKRARTALVLGAGGIKSVCHVGLLRVLERENIPIDLVVGSSGGSLFGAAWALGTRADQIEHWIHRFWKKSSSAFKRLASTSPASQKSAMRTAIVPRATPTALSTRPRRIVSRNTGITPATRAKPAISTSSRDPSSHRRRRSFGR